MEEVLRRGSPGRAIVVRWRGSGLRCDDGDEMHTLVLNVLAPPGSPGPAVQVTAVVALSEADRDLIRVGAEVPIAVLAGAARVVAVDLDAARAERDDP